MSISLIKSAKSKTLFITLAFIWICLTIARKDYSFVPSEQSWSHLFEVKTGL